MSSFFSLVERPYEIIEKGIKQEFQPASKSEQLQFRKWLKTTKQEIDVVLEYIESNFKSA